METAPQNSASPAESESHRSESASAPGAPLTLRSEDLTFSESATSAEDGPADDSLVTSSLSTGTDSPEQPAADIESGWVAFLTGLQLSERQFLRLLLVVFLVVFGVEWLLIASQKPKPIAVQRGEGFQNYFSVEINSATWIDWMQLEGIGPTLAHRLEADRKMNGPFRSIDDVARVPGIGPVKLQQIRPWLVCDEIDAATESVSQRVSN